MATFATRVKELRKKQGLTQSGLAESLGLAKVTITMWERGVNKPTTDRLFSIADYFNVTPAYLIGQSDDSSPPDEADPSSFGIWGDEYDLEELEKAMLRLFQLSPTTRRIVIGTITEAYRIDRENNMLRAEDESKMNVKAIVREWG